MSRFTDVTIIDDTSVLLVELSIFRYTEGLPIMNIRRDLTPIKNSSLTTAAVDSFELITLSLFVYFILRDYKFYLISVLNK